MKHGLYKKVSKNKYIPTWVLSTHEWQNESILLDFYIFYILTWNTNKSNSRHFKWKWILIASCCLMTSAVNMKKKWRNSNNKILNSNKTISTSLCFQLNIFCYCTIIVHLYWMIPILSNEFPVSFCFVVSYQKQSPAHTHTQYVRSFVHCVHKIFVIIITIV